MKSPRLYTTPKRPQYCRPIWSSSTHRRCSKTFHKGTPMTPHILYIYIYFSTHPSPITSPYHTNPPSHTLSLFIRDRERERERERERGRDTGRRRSRLHAPGARRGIRSRVSRIAPWAKGRRQTAEPPRDPPSCDSYLKTFFLCVTKIEYDFR